MITNMLPRDRYNAKKKAQYEKRKAKHLPRLIEIVNTMTITQMVEDTGTTRSFVERVIREEGLRQRGKP